MIRYFEAGSFYLVQEHWHKYTLNKNYKAFFLFVKQVNGHHHAQLTIMIIDQSTTTASEQIKMCNWDVFPNNNSEDEKISPVTMKKRKENHIDS